MQCPVSIQEGPTIPQPATYDIDPGTFWTDPYPDLARLRADLPVAFVPQLGAVLITRRDDVFQNEKKTDVFSSVQPDGLMTRLMGQNMMRKDGDDHLSERRATFPTVSPKTVRDHCRPGFGRTPPAFSTILRRAGPAIWFVTLPCRYRARR